MSKHLALQTSDNSVTDLNPAGGKIHLHGDFHNHPSNVLYAVAYLFGFNVAFNFSVISVIITTVSGCDRELNAHFYSAA